jgi:hypothetical protein
LPSPSEVRVATDFDNTITPRNMGEVLVVHYLFSSGKDPFVQRARRVLGLAKRSLYGQYLIPYTQILRRIPREDWRRVLAAEPINPAWRRAVRRIRKRTGAQRIHLTVVSRNTSDVILAWIAVHERELAALGVVLNEVIANKPMDETRDIHVRVRDGVLRRAGDGRLKQEGKRRYVSNIPFYIGDSGERVFEPYVKEFIPV